MKNVVVYCGSRRGSSESYADAALELGKLLAARGIGLVYGGGRVGLMGILADAVMQNGGRVVGVIPKRLNIQEVENANVTEVIEVDSMHERKLIMSERSDGAIALPGGFGTLDELFEFLTWTQLGIHTKPCGLLNICHYFDHLLGFLKTAVHEGFIRREHRKLLVDAANPATLLRQMDF